MTAWTVDRALDSALCCPVCRSAPLAPDGAARRCTRCGRAFPVAGGVDVLVPDPAVAEASFYAAEEEARYGRGASTMGSAFADPVREFLAALPRDRLVVELGSGQGAFDGAHPGYVATDYSLFALQTYSTGARIQADAERLPFRTGSVDAFFSVGTLEHIPRPHLALAEIDRCLKPGGRALLFPTWYVRPWAAKGLTVRPYGGLSWSDRVRKTSIPLRNCKPYQFAVVLPGRIAREVALLLGRDVPFRYRRLSPNLDEYVTTDSDAFASLDPHAVAAYFLGRGYRDLRRPNALHRLLYAFEPVSVEKLR